MKDIDKWFAEQCSVEIEGFYGWFQMIDGEPVKDGQHWTIHDPRCREVIREKFRLKTVWFGTGWFCHMMDEFNSFADVTCRGKNIAEAETACCEAIYEAQK